MHIHMHIHIYTHTVNTVYVYGCVHCSTDMDMDLGTDRGRQLLRVLVQMVMVNHAPLASQALQLLIRHFSQRKEMVEGFKQVSVGREGERERERGREREREKQRWRD